jgi:hypothetical protein
MENQGVSDVYQIDKGILQWLMGAAGTLILFMLGFGFKDLKDRLNKLPQLCLEIERLKAKYDRDIAQLYGELKLLSQRIDDLEGR